jgi:hypothetical protein
MRIAVAMMIALMALSGCKGMGMGHMSGSGWDADSPEQKADESWWDRMYGRKAISRESSDWKDYYAAPAGDQTRPDYCGYWGNCAPVTTGTPGGCNFYGNCDSGTSKSGW